MRSLAAFFRVVMFLILPILSIVKIAYFCSRILLALSVDNSVDMWTNKKPTPRPFSRLCGILVIVSAVCLFSLTGIGLLPLVCKIKYQCSFYELVILISVTLTAQNPKIADFVCTTSRTWPYMVYC